MDLSNKPASGLSKERKEDLRSMSKSLQNEQHSIVKFASFLTCYKHQAKHLAQNITQLFIEEGQKLKGNELAEKRLLYFYVANETIFRTKDSGIEYVRAFGDQLHDWVDKFTSSQQDNFYIMDALQRVIQLWEDEFIFAKSFTDVLKQYIKPQLELSRQKLHQNQSFDANHPMMGNQIDPYQSQIEQTQRLLSKQLKAINMFDETQSAVQLELNVQKLNVQSQLKDLNNQISQIERKMKDGKSVSMANEFDPVKQKLFDLKRDQQELVVEKGIKLMFQLGALVDKERSSFQALYKECYEDSASSETKLQRYMQELKRRKQGDGQA